YEYAKAGPPEHRPRHELEQSEAGQEAGWLKATGIRFGRPFAEAPNVCHPQCHAKASWQPRVVPLAWTSPDTGRLPPPFQSQPAYIRTVNDPLVTTRIPSAVR